MTMIPVITTEDKYDKPTRQSSGRFVVDANKVNGQLDKVYLFNTDDRKYYYVDEQNSTPDFIAQARKYEESLSNYRNEQEKKAALYAISNNPTQVNSLADVWAKGLSLNPFKTAANLVQNTATMFYNYTIKPFYESDASMGERTGILLNNALVNLGETMDYFTGANAVKALAQGHNPIDAMRWDNKEGRPQYDWNIDTGNGLLDLGANFFLEYISDPTNWLTFGASATLKSSAKNGITDIIMKSGKDIGLNIATDQADDIANVVIKQVINNNTPLAVALGSAPIAKKLKLDSPDTVASLLRSMSNNTKLFKETQSLSVLKSINNTADAINNTAMKLATRTSALGWGADLVKLGFKGSAAGLSYALAKTNKAILDGAATKQLANINTTTRATLDNISMLSEVLGAGKELPDKVLRRITAKLQSDAMLDLRARINTNKNNVQALTDSVNKWAQSHGFQDITDAHFKLIGGKTRISEGLRYVEQEVFNGIQTAMFQGVKDTVEPLINIFKTPSNLYNMSTQDVTKLNDLLKSKTLYSILPEGTVNAETYTVVEQIVSSQMAMHYMNDINNLINNMDIVQLAKDAVYIKGGLDPIALATIVLNSKQIKEIIDTVNSTPELLQWLSTDIKEWFKFVDYDALLSSVNGMAETALRKRFRVNPETATKVLRNLILSSGGLQRRLAVWYPELERAFQVNAFELSNFSRGLRDALEDADKMLTHHGVIKPINFGTIGKNLKESPSNAMRVALKKNMRTEESIRSAFIDNSKELIAKKFGTLKNETKVYNGIIKAIRENENIKDFSWLIADSNLSEYMHTWLSDGLTVDTALYLRAMIKPLVPQEVYNELEDLIDILMEETYANIPLTVQQLMSHLDVTKLSQANSLSYILSTPSITDAMDQIYTNSGIGTLTDVLSSLGTDSTLGKSAQTLKTLAHSIYVSNGILATLDKVPIDPLWKGGIQDALAGMSRMHIDEVPSVEYLSDYILSKAKTFVDNSRSNRANLAPLIDDAKLPAYRVLKIREKLNSLDWVEIVDELTADKDNPTYDIIYSIGQTGVNKGNIYEFSYSLPDGTVVRLVDNTVKQYEDMLLDSSEHAFQVYGTNKNRAKKLLQEQEAAIKGAVTEFTFDTSEEFMTAVYNVFSLAKEESRKTDSIIRLLGFDNAGETLNSDKILNSFLANNLLNAKISKEFSNKFSGITSVDLAQLIRIKAFGAVPITDDVRHVVEQVVTEAKKYLDEANLYNDVADEAKAMLVPDFNKDVLTSLDDIIYSIDNALLVMEGTSKTLSYISEDEFNALRSLGARRLADLRARFNGLKLDLTDSLKIIGASNADGAKNIIVRQVFNQLSGEPNILKFIQDNLSTDGVMSGYGIKRVHRPRLFDDWYGLRNYIQGKRKNDLTGITLKKAAVLTEEAAKLQYIVDSIRHPELILELPDDSLRYVMTDLRALSDGLDTSAYNAFQVALTEMKTLNKAQMYAVTQRYLSFAKKNSTDPKFMKNLHDKLSQQYGSTFARAIVSADDTVMFKGNLYVGGVPKLHSPLIKEDNLLLEFKEQLDVIDKAANIGNTLSDSLVAEDKLREFTGFDMPHMRTKERAIRAYADFINDIKDTFTKAYHAFYTNTPDNADVALRMRKMYTATIEHYNQQVIAIADSHALYRANTILDMDTNTYTKYLYKYSQGVQVFDLDSELFQKPEILNKLATFTKTIGEHPETGLRYYMSDAEQRWMYVYIDNKNKTLLSELEKGIEPIVPPKNMYTPDNMFSTRYRRLADTLNEQLDEAYELSMQRSMNPSKYEDEFLANMPSELKARIIDLDYLYEHDMLSGLNHTIVGDYGSGRGELYTTYSNNLVSNVASGMNSVFNNLRGKEIYVDYVTNNNNTLQKRMEYIANRTGVEVTAQDVRDALNNTGYTIIGFKDNKIVEYVVKDERTLAEALQNNAILTDYGTYDRLQLMFNDNRIHGLWYKLLATPLLFLKLGMLGTPGWFARNIPDSFLKGMIGQNADASYLTTSLVDTVKHIQEYTRIEQDIFKRYKGKVNAQTIYKYFADSTITKRMDKQLFNKMFYFYSSSSSTATAAQLSMYNNLATKLYTNFGKDSIITRTDVNTLIKSFVDNNGKYSVVKNAIYRDLGKDKAEQLMRLFSQIPKNYGNNSTMNKLSDMINKVMDVNPVMRGSNYIETLSRMHAFLYASDYMAGTVSKGMRIVDATQFNRAHDSAGKKLLETLLPFSSFQIDNVLFWMDALSKSRTGVLSAINSYLSARYDEEELDAQDLADSVALRYLFLNGNIVIDESIGNTLKIGDSLSGALQLITDPISGLAEMVNVPTDIIIKLIKSANADPDKYKEDSFNNPKPLGDWDARDWSDEMLQLVPFFGALVLRERSAWARTEYNSAVLPVLLPSIFGAVKTDEAGTTYNSRPIGYDWYANTAKDPTFKSKHRFVFGLSYVPSWLSKDPATYVNTRQRLINMGYDADTATKMVTEWGYYMKAPDYILRQFIPKEERANQPKRSRYAKKSYPTRTYAKPYAKRSYPPRAKAVKVRGSLTGMDFDYTNSRGQRVFRPYRVNNFKRRVATMNGNLIARNLLVKYMGYNASSERMFREHRQFRRSRLDRLARQNTYTRIKIR